MFQISENHRYFEKDGRPNFYLADTCWSAFTNIEEEDWEYYLNVRKTQGFDVIQINMLWQWDASTTDLNYMPFEQGENGFFDFSKPRADYFDRAERMMKSAYQKGLTVALVLLWSNYVPNTWASDSKINQVGLFPKELVEPYVEMVVKRYQRFHPIYIISGDTDFQTAEVEEAYYNTALNTVKRCAPDAITSLHIRGREADLPKVLKENPNLDFYMYQSGHNRDYQEMGYQLAETFYRMKPIRPVINSEPCYEMMGYSHCVYGRFSREDIRRVAWQSVLSGAHAGITYGAHGIWSWHLEDKEFGSVGEMFESPYDWHVALQFEGAKDYAFIKQFIEANDLFDLVPNQDRIKNDSNTGNSGIFSEVPGALTAKKEIRLAENKEFLIAYVPSNIKVRIAGELTEKTMYYLDLESKKMEAVTASYDVDSDLTIVNMHHFTKDTLLIIKK